MRNSWLSYAALFALIAALVAGYLFLSRRDASLTNGYAGYSSFRADPSGCQVLFESLSAMDNLAVSRNFRETNQYHGAGTTLLVIGVSETSLLSADALYFAEWERLAHTNRIVLAVEPSPDVLDLSETRKKSQLAKRWGVELGKAPAVKKGGSVVWRRAFDRHDGWTADSSDEQKPVLIQRRFGIGSIVLASDSLVFSNGELAARAHADLLSKMIGANRTIQFDEAHFGITETGSVMGLVRKYRLQGLLAGLAILAGLFLWQRSAEFPSLLPETTPAGLALAVTGRDAQQGLLRLLRRHIPSGLLISECLKEWHKSAPRDPRFARMEQAANAERDPLRAYLSARKQFETRETETS